MIHRMETELLVPTNAESTIVEEAQNYLGIPLKDVKRISVYQLLCADGMETSVLYQQCQEIFCDPIIENIHFEDWNIEQDGAPADWFIDVRYRAGVTDTVARSAEEAFALFGHSLRVATGTLYALFGNLTKEQCHRIGFELLANHLIQEIHIYSKNDAQHHWKRFQQPTFPEVCIHKPQSLYTTFDVGASIEQWMDWSVQNCWALDEFELAHILSYYQQEKVQTQRTSLGLPKNPTDVEIEIFAQTWSEHCKHKIFSADVFYEENIDDEKFVKLGNQNISSLFKTYIRAATEEIENTRKIPWLRSVFHDNAGVVDFDAHIDLAIKVETHNSPSALDPYGGAITGILGVNRDILGVGMGAKPIGNMDVFCFAHPQWPLKGDEDLMPVGLKTPKRLLEGVHKGVRDGGNNSGIPTINGAIFFDQNYAGKPLVFVGTIGVMPKKLPNEEQISGIEKKVCIGDHIFMVGGAIGADGIHGATFSSLELNENSPATAVQIGDPMTQKRMTDFLLEARDLGLYSCITDNGAGGLSSSVGEMATLCGGAFLDLSKAPTKYPNLQPWQLMISESQERMTCAVPPEKTKQFTSLAKQRGVVATDLGIFTDSGNLVVNFDGDLVALVNLAFLHDSLPPMQIPACWNGSIQRTTWIDRDDRKPSTGISWTEKFYTLLSSVNIASKEFWVRQYDHEVQGATHIKPFGGQTQKSPNDSGVIWLYPHGGEMKNTVCVGCGLQPKMSLYDPYVMAQYAVDEAVRNVVATGGDIDQTCLLDNFCWPDPIKSNKIIDGDFKMGQLVRACKGLYDTAKIFGTPLVSGKDSMKNDFRGKNGRGEPIFISILPTLLVTAMSRGSLERSQSSSFKNAGDRIFWLGKRERGLIGSEYAEHFVLSKEENTLADVDLIANLELYRNMKRGQELALLSSIHDISDGGILCALAECCFGNMFGVDIVLPTMSNVSCFSEGTGQFVVSVERENVPMFKEIFAGIDMLDIGAVTDTGRFVVNDSIDETIVDVLSYWTKGF